MDITKLFKDALIYPTKDWGKLMILGLFMVIIAILAIVSGISIAMGQIAVSAILGTIMGILLVIIGLIYNGYSLSIISETIKNIHNSDNLPDFNWSNNIVDGLKVLVLNILYMIIPIVVTIILAYLLGIFTDVSVFSQYLLNNASFLSNPTAVDSLIQMRVNETMVQAIFVILAIIFSLFAIVAKARLADTGKFGSIIEFKEIFNSISNIGWGNYIIWFILMLILVIIISFVAALILVIPIIGFVIYFLIAIPYLLIFSSRAVGLIYNESKEQY